MRPSAFFLACAVTLGIGCVPSYEITPDLPPTRPCPDREGSSPNAAVDWYFPALSSDNQKLQRWCEVLGPVELDSIPSDQFGPLRSGDSLLVAVWNTDAGAGYLTEFFEQEMGLECNGESSRLRPGSGQFVVLIQEALRRSNDIPDVPKSRYTPPPVKENVHPGPRLDVIEAARECGLAYFYAPAARNDYRQREGKREDKGNAILSTLPLSDPIVVELPFEAARRAVPLVTVHDEARDSLRLASVHLITTPPPWRVLTTGSSSRWRQAMGVIDALDRIEESRGRAACGVERAACSGISTLIAGDLNTWSTRETALRHLLEHFPDSPPVLENPTRGPFPTDHLLFRTGPDTGIRVMAHTYRRIEDTYYSDHNPIVAYLRFN